ncbi:rod shape-determining protein RodA [Nocardioides baekrokdamisoli]|uniref:peptidoglycan glycosyltransferase n=1 Tax=Nocardioides baekrokdamisoli TaxID=1804624 RepID=A0A3G9IGA3_9ACTN|nr:rod shape-determining protein RodA [Nocardioides baekrokdamisoli]BBH18080.1 rod shape-determining protein RodA [Nocardioides baekrokdamisoli]
MIRAGRRGGADWWLFAAVGGLMVISPLVVWSATQNGQADGGAGGVTYLVKQLINIAIGLVLMVVAMRTDYRMIRLLTPIVYLGSVLGLILVLAIGTNVNGHKAWIQFGPVSIQPAEFAKLAVVVSMALVIAERSERRGRTMHVVTPRDLLAMLALVVPPALLIILQPDLGTEIVLGVTVFGVLAVAGTPAKWLAGMAATTLVGIAVVVQAHVLKQYQIDRFMAFTNPNLDRQGAGFNVQQAKIAIGDGGWFGQGLFHGQVTRSGLVPEQHTDFIFTVVGEELGLIGALVVVGLLGVILWRCLVIARNSPDMFGRVCAAGFATWFGFEAFENAGMCVGIMPVTGVPMPFVSYGGSAMFACLAAVGLLQNFHRRTS